MKTRFLLHATLFAFLCCAPCIAQGPAGDPPPHPPAAATTPPAPAAEDASLSDDKTAERVTVKLEDGSILEGEVPASVTVPIQGAGLKADLDIRQIDTITLSADHLSAIVEMQNGDRISGAPGIKSLTVRMVFGAVPVDWVYIHSLTVHPADLAAQNEAFGRRLYGVQWTWNGAWHFTFEKDGSNPGIGFVDWKIVKPYLIEYRFADGNHGAITFRRDMERAAIDEINPQGRKNPITLYRIDNVNY